MLIEVGMINNIAMCQNMYIKPWSRQNVKCLRMIQQVGYILR